MQAIMPYKMDMDMAGGQFLYVIIAGYNIPASFAFSKAGLKSIFPFPTGTIVLGARSNSFTWNSGNLPGKLS